MLTTDQRARERILAYGPQGGGKTRGAAQWASKMERVWWVDNDDSFDRLSETFDLEHVKVRYAHDWDSNVKAFDEIWAEAERDDLVVVDNATSLWTDVQLAYAHKALGDDLADWLLAQRFGKGEDTRAMELMKEQWSFINPMYKQKFGDRLKHCPGHLFVIAEASSVSYYDNKATEAKGKETKDLYGAYKLKPEGQKRLGFGVSTVLLFTKDKDGYYLTTVKDREREELEGEEWGNFTRTYLKDIAGWRKE